MRPVGRLLLCRVVRVGLVKVFPTSRGLSLSGYLLVLRVVYRLPPGDPCCSFGFHLTDVPSGQLSELSSQLPKLTAHSSVFLRLPDCLTSTKTIPYPSPNQQRHQANAGSLPMLARLLAQILTIRL